MAVSPPRPKMPHLNSLRAFEAAARNCNIAVAAQELCVTPAAVSQQIKTLEAWAGAELFKRNPQGVELTPLGAGVLNEFVGAFDQLGSAVQKLRNEAKPFDIRIAALPSIAQFWLSPRLPAIRAARPEISISVSALEQPPNLKREPFDLLIFFSDSDLEGYLVEIGKDCIFPVCSRKVAKRLKRIEDLANETFLYDSTWKDDWANWLASAAPSLRLNKTGPEYSLYSLALEEAKNDAGVLIGHEVLVRQLLEDGVLVAPFTEKVILPRELVIASRSAIKKGTVLTEVIEMLLS